MTREVGLTRKVVYLRIEQRVADSGPGKEHKPWRICASEGAYPVDDSTTIGMEVMFLQGCGHD